MFRVQTRTLVFFVFVFFFFAFFPHRAKIQPPQMQFPFCLGMSPKEPWKVNPIKGIEKRETKKPHRVCWRAALFVGVQVRVCALYWRICFFFPFFFFCNKIQSNFYLSNLRSAQRRGRIYLHCYCFYQRALFSKCFFCYLSSWRLTSSHFCAESSMKGRKNSTRIGRNRLKFFERVVSSLPKIICSVLKSEECLIL